MSGAAASAFAAVDAARGVQVPLAKQEDLKDKTGGARQKGTPLWMAFVVSRNADCWQPGMHA